MRLTDAIYFARLLTPVLIVIAVFRRREGKCAPGASRGECVLSFLRVFNASRGLRAIVVQLPPRLCVAPEAVRSLVAALSAVAVHHHVGSLDAFSLAHILLTCGGVYILTLAASAFCCSRREREHRSSRSFTLLSANARTPTSQLCSTLTRCFGSTSRPRAWTWCRRDALLARLGDAVTSLKAPPVDYRSLVGLAPCAYIIGGCVTPQNFIPFSLSGAISARHFSHAGQISIHVRFQCLASTRAAPRARCSQLSPRAGARARSQTRRGAWVRVPPPLFVSSV